MKGMKADSPHILDVVELRSGTGRWPAGTTGTVVDTQDDHVLVEISDDRGRGIEFLEISEDAVAPAASAAQHRATP